MLAKPIGSNLIVKVKTKENLSAGGIFLGVDKKNPVTKHRGVVVASGRGHLNSDGTITPFEVQDGQEAMFEDGTSIFKDDEFEYFVVSEFSILCVFVEEFNTPIVEEFNMPIGVL
jgi:co-chaperonin GroES (HSP10)